ncbi:MAG: CHASE domain-containing protein, partial [Alphaproteobacteria bacterium]|nr:CHASE domain-containing protein [Alphaproteobacteria bacterium]
MGGSTRTEAKQGQKRFAPETSGQLPPSGIGRLFATVERGRSGRSANGASRLRGNLPAAIVLLVGLGLTAAAFHVTRDLYRSVVEQEFDRQASHYVLALHKATDRHLELVNMAAGLSSESSPVDSESNPVDSRSNPVDSRWDFYKFAKDRLAYYPGFQALGWVPIVPESEREAYIRRAEADGLRGFAFTEIT